MKLFDLYEKDTQDKLKKLRKDNDKIIGYTAGVFDLFHIGHLNLLRNAKSLCDYLIVGVTTDDLVEYKHKKSVIPFHERSEIVRNIKFVDLVLPQRNMDKMETWKKLKYNLMIVGDDWYGTEKWDAYEKDFNKVGVQIIYLPYTVNTSSTLINEILEDQRKVIRKQKEKK